MELKVSRRSGVSIHIQLKEQIKGLILKGVLSEGKQLPTVRQLADYMKINKNTVVKIYKELEKENYIYSIKGKGTFVKADFDKIKVSRFFNKLDEVLNYGLEIGLDITDIWGSLFYRSQKYRSFGTKTSGNKIALIECNLNSIKELKKVLTKNIPEIEVVPLLIEDLKNNLPKIEELVEKVSLIIVPFIHFEEIKKEVEKLNKSILTIGAGQSIKILTYASKIKNKNVGIISFSEEDEKSIKKQLNKLNAKEFILYGGIDEKGLINIEKFEKKCDIILVCSSIEKEVNFNKKTFKISGRYDSDDIQIILQILKN